ncbi:hypothetical protein K431DRAFT_288479 [Polychaeton citri CBS 116435]|uniref:High-temperature-induced dauer-formation protein n=1 Tax=Polychaeton citri CBS 116435 TaxID=1314669 RepID=A0A9P4UKJ0_9PEZI|nr:hypothetical protein K431DRAFT_288479 [Polychaeton citri CBS 116435]
MGASESKLAFKEDIFRLAREPDIPATDQWWTRFYQLPESADDVFSLWSTNDLHALTRPSASPGQQGQQQPQLADSALHQTPKKNAETLIYSCVARLQSLQTRYCYADPQTPIAPEVLNCVRVLTRLLPYIYENEALTGWEDAFFWQSRKPSTMWDHKANQLGPAYDGLQPKKTFPSGARQDEIGPPLGELLIDLLVNYLFFPGFTIAKELDEAGKPSLQVSYKIWQSGIGCKQSNGMTKDNERNAVEVLRLLLTLSSRAMYTSPGVFAQTDIRPLTYMATQSSRQVVLSLICSLLNTVCRYNPASWRVPIDLPSIAKDPKQQLVSHSVQFLLVLITYNVHEGIEPNAFRKALGRLHRAEDFQFIQHGLNTVLTQPVSGMPSYLPGKGTVPWAPETLQLFWELLQCNKRFRNFIIDTDRAHDFVILVLYYSMDAKDEPSKQGILRMCIFILQTLSVEAGFGMRLNKQFIGQETLPSIMRIQNFHGNYTDYLITTIHTLITSTKGRLEPLYPALFAVMSNVAPHTQDLQRATSSKLMEMFALFSAPKFLLASEANHNLLTSILETMSALLEHQYQANRRFVDVVVRSQRRFLALRDFIVEGALDELDRHNKDRKDRGEFVRGMVVESPNPLNPTAASPSDVREDGLFAVGDDDDDDDDEDPGWGTTSNSRPRPMSQSSSARQSVDTEILEGAMPLQTRSMSEKARGKQPVGFSSFSRPASQSASTTSLASQAQGEPREKTGLQEASGTYRRDSYFEPTAEWLSTWLPHLPLHAILATIEFENERVALRKQGKLSKATETTGRVSGDAIDHQAPRSSADGIEDASSSTLDEKAAQAGNAPLAQTPVFHSQYVKVQSFTWSPLSIGWYGSMLWSWIYASDVVESAQNGIWIGTRIRLFNVITAKETKITLRNPRGAVDAAGNAIAERLGNLSVRTSTKEV